MNSVLIWMPGDEIGFTPYSKFSQNKIEGGGHQFSGKTNNIYGGIISIIKQITLTANDNVW